MRISLAIPSNRGIRPKTAKCLLELVRGGYEWHIIVAEEGYTIAENRNYIVVQALNNKSDYLLMIDDDMIFPPDLLDKLLKNKKEICGVAFHPRMDDMKTLDETHWLSIKQNNRNEVFESKATGTGIILIKCEVFYKVPRPWFEFTYHESGKCKQGEDWNFCEKARQAGFKIYTDPTILVGHIGDKIY